MKKLSLKALKLGAKEVLTREQLKYVLGGFNATAEDNCSTLCKVNSSYQVCKAVVISGVPKCECPGGTSIACH